MKTARAHDPKMLDAWLRTQLNARFDAALREPLPDCKFGVHPPTRSVTY